MYVCLCVCVCICVKVMLIAANTNRMKALGWHPAAMGYGFGCWNHFQFFCVHLPPNREKEDRCSFSHSVGETKYTAVISLMPLHFNETFPRWLTHAVTFGNVPDNSGFPEINHWNFEVVIEISVDGRSLYRVGFRKSKGRPREHL